MVPEWNRELMELRYGGQLVKAFHRPAPNQFAILDAFQESRWAMLIDDPLHWIAGINAKRRLRDAISDLNEHHLLIAIRFHGNGDEPASAGSGFQPPPPPSLERKEGKQKRGGESDPNAGLKAAIVAVGIAKAVI